MANQKLLTKSKTKKGFTMPTQKRIASILRANSKAFVIRMFLSAFRMLTKTNKIKVLIEIEKGALKKTIKKVISKTKSKSKSKKKGKKLKGKEKAAFLRRINKGRRAAGLKPIKSKA